jgi:small subunit ribosomal protein S18
MIKKPIKKKKDCIFCKEKKVPQWQDYEKLRDYLSPRARILGKDMTGVCVRHQKDLATAIKQARHLGLLPFVNLM